MGSTTGNTTDQAPANPAATDGMPATQPIGYWSGLAHATVTRHLRDAMARTDDGQRLHLTDTGEAARVRLRELATEVRAEAHQGISDEEYVAALKVLRRMVANIEADGNPGATPRTS
ncbi:hypothetical protein [Streptomyces anulatus]|uniref:hypothetical protein n=1 Tax=Streptomyces anulatus TaxID=1892 RepID=UPI0036342A42